MRMKQGILVPGKAYNRHRRSALLRGLWLNHIDITARLVLTKCKEQNEIRME